MASLASSYGVIACYLVLILLSAGCLPAPLDGRECVASYFLLEKDARFVYETETNRISVKVTIFIVGCQREIGMISDSEMVGLREHLRRSHLWNPLNIHAASKPGVPRSAMVDDLNGVLGRKVVTEILVVEHEFIYEG